MNYRSEKVWLMEGDCLERLKEIPDGSVDMILADPPYGTTACKWDSIIPLQLMWEQLKRVIKPSGAIALSSAQPFTSNLIMSNPSMFKYDWVWEKPSAKGHFNAKKRPMVAHESVVIFYDKQPTYNPQMTHNHIRKTSIKDKSLNSEVYNKNTKTVSYDSTSRYPRSVQIFKQDTQKTSLHPTQKPVALMEYMIKTYTNEDETVLDFTMGSGTTGVAAKNLNRKFIGIELDNTYFNIAKERILEENNMIKIHLTREELKEALDFAEFHDYNVITIRHGEDKMKERYVTMSEFNSNKREVCITDLEYRV